MMSVLLFGAQGQIPCEASSCLCLRHKQGSSEMMFFCLGGGRKQEYYLQTFAQVAAVIKMNDHTFNVSDGTRLDVGTQL